MRAMTRKERRNGVLARSIVPNHSNELSGLGSYRGSRVKPCQKSCQNCGKRAVPMDMPRIGDRPMTPGCPWCHRTFLTWSLAKIHLKNSDKAPCPRWKDLRRGEILADFRPWDRRNDFAPVI